MNLIFSPDDNGYYFQRFSDWKTSQLFKTEKEAIKARKENKLIWEA